MKKQKVILLVIILLLYLILVSIIINQNININKKSITIKKMSESEQVTDLNNQINELNTSHKEYMNYIQTCKTQIATALTNEGVTTSNDATLETMAESISKVLQTRTADADATADNITEGKIAYVKGEKITGTGADNTASYDKGAEDTSIAKQIKLTNLMCSNNRSDQCGKYDLTLDISQYKKMSVVGGGYSGSQPTFQCIIYLDGTSYSTALNPNLTNIDISNNSTFRLFLYCYTGSGSGYIKINSITFE